jgi:hypothetical protein
MQPRRLIQKSITTSFLTGCYAIVRDTEITKKRGAKRAVIMKSLVFDKKSTGIGKSFMKSCSET